MVNEIFPAKNDRYNPEGLCLSFYCKLIGWKRACCSGKGQGADFGGAVDARTISRTGRSS